ncbi:MAG: ATP-binding protein [Deferribacterales bacterium]
MKKILVVEDEVIIGLDISQKLQSLNYHVIAAVCSPEDAVVQIRQQVPDMVLMDINLKSVIDGIELAKDIQEYGKIPVIFLTSYSDLATIERAVKTEPYGYIVKPYTIGVLASTVQTAFKRVALEQESDQNKQMLSTLIDSISNAVAVITDDIELERANSYIYKIFDVEDGDFEGLQAVCSEVFDKRTISELRDSGAQDIIHFNFRGEVKHLLLSVTSLIWEHNKRLLLNVTDLSEMYKIKTALSEAESRFSKIFRKKMVPAVLVNCTTGMIYEMNEAFMDTYEVPRDKDTDSHILEYLGDSVVAKLAGKQDMDGIFKMDRVMQTLPSGREFHADFRAKKVMLDGTEYYLLDVYDVTEQILMENAEKEMQQKLIHANKMTSLGTLVSGVAHEINNPNNFIMFNSSLLVEFWDSIYKEFTGRGITEVDGMPLEELRSDIEKLMEGIGNGSERIKNIVQDLKGFAKHETSDSFEPVDLCASVTTAIRILEHQINKSTENFVVNICCEGIKVNAIKQKLEQVLINILMNALEAIVSNTDLVEVSVLCQDGACVINVIDEGVGIPKDNLDRVTDPFFTTRQGEGGTGLGLSIAYSIIQEHKGSIEIHSEEGKGTVVKIVLPMVGNEQ